MVGINNLEVLLKSMKPELIEGAFVFVTTKGDFSKLSPILIFKEKEGTTIIIKKETADKNKIKYETVWAMITLTIHSDLNAVGFLATITKKLAEKGISVNAVSAFYHDHLFVPFEKRTETMTTLKLISKK